MMEVNLVGYLLGGLDPVNQREVEEYLRNHPEAGKQLGLLRGALQPLAADRENVGPPSDLWVRTLARVAEHRTRDFRPIPKAPPVQQPAISRSWWRRADVLVAACLLLVVLPLLPTGLSYLKQRHNIAACQNNLRMFHMALRSYSDLHGGALPKVEEFPPLNVAGVFIPALNQDRLLGRDASVKCPTNGFDPPRQISLWDLVTEYDVNPNGFERLVAELAGCYAYSLGYRGPGGQHYGLRYRADEPENDHIPVMADRPPFKDQRDVRQSLTANSLNHGGKGQNVLYLGGNVQFFTTRNVGVNRDDIYLNRNNFSAAGVDRLDTVLGSSNFRPYPSAVPLPR